MPKIASRQILAAKLDEILRKSGESNNSLAARAKIAQSHVGRIRRQETAATIDMLDQIAEALGMRAWELLLDAEDLRRSVYEQAIMGPRDPLAAVKIADHYPRAPKHDQPIPKTARPRRRKKPGKGD